MSPDQIDTAIAEHLGWTHIQGIADFRLYGLRPNSDGEKYRHCAVPQFHRCLNAMADAVNSLTDAQWIRYLQILSGETDVENSSWPTCFLNLEAVREMVSAKAITQAIGLLRTIGKYQEPEKLQTHVAV